MYRVGSIARVLLVLACVSWSSQVRADPFLVDSDEFPIIMMSAEISSHSSMAAMGVDYVHTYSGASAAFFDSAAAHGLYVMNDLKGVHWAQQADGLEQVRSVVLAYKDHPALGFWYLADEPSTEVSASDLTSLYTMIKQETPGILVANAECWCTGWQDYQGAQDMLMVDYYPVRSTAPFPEQDISLAMQFVESALALDDQPVIPIFQSFNWQVFYSGTPSRFPVAEELRYWSYASIALGVRGLAWWSHYRGMEFTGGPEWFDNAFTPVMHEVRQFVDSVAPAHLATQISGGEAAHVYLSVWNRSGGTWVVVVNKLNIPNTVSVSLDGQVPDGALTPWGTSANIPATVSGGHLQPLTLGPHEVRVWTLADDDRDDDGVNDSVDNCPDTPNADQANQDGDAYGDACDDDQDAAPAADADGPPAADVDGGLDEGASDERIAVSGGCAGCSASAAGPGGLLLVFLVFLVLSRRTWPSDIRGGQRRWSKAGPRDGSRGPTARSWLGSS